MRTLNRVLFVALMAGADDTAATGTATPSPLDTVETQTFHYVRSPNAGLGRRKLASVSNQADVIVEPPPAHRSAVAKFMKTVFVVTLISFGIALIWRGFDADFIRKSRPIRQR